MLKTHGMWIICALVWGWFIIGSLIERIL